MSFLRQGARGRVRVLPVLRRVALERQQVVDEVARRRAVAIRVRAKDLVDNRTLKKEQNNRKISECGPRGFLEPLRTLAAQLLR
jgi:hypothetical protein